MNDLMVIGVDPAPTKPAVLFDGTHFVSVPPVELAEHIEGRLAAHEGPCILAWDSPLQLDPGNFYSRRVDDAAGRRVKELVQAGRLEAKSVGVAPAAGCPHNLLAQAVLGLPTGAPRFGLEHCSRSSLPAKHRIVAEVHPAVAVAAVWLEAGIEQSMPRYKGSKKRFSEFIGIVRDHLPLPSSIEDDDQFDAWMAWNLGHGLVAGEAIRWGPEDGGYYLMPKSWCPKGQTWPDA